MGNVIVFRRKEGVEAEEQVKAFIDWAKGLTGFDKPNLPLDWAAWRWKDWMGVSLDFVKLGVVARSKSFDPSKGLLDSNMMDFAKAYVLQKQTLNSTREIIEIVAIRAVEKALLNAGLVPDITRVNAHIYDDAGTLIEQEFTPDRAYRVGTQLQKLSEFIAEKGLAESKDTWVNSIKRPNDSHGHVKNKKNAQKKMPTEEALNALAEIWAAGPTYHRDIFSTSNCALLLASPSRVGELNVLAADCLIYKDNSEGKSELFINWYGQKGYGFTDKAVPEVWKFFAEESVRRIKKITDKPRKLAKFLEENPDEFPIHDNCPKVAQDTPLTPEQVLEAFCVDLTKNPRSKLKAWLKSAVAVLSKKRLYVKSVEILQEQLDNMYEGRWQEGKEDRYTLTLRKLNIYLREYWLPPEFPYTDHSHKMKYQDALNCYFEGQMHVEGKGYFKPFSLMAIDNNILNSCLTEGASEAGKAKSKSLNIFKRWQYEGEEYSMTTHQFRHYLNTIAAKGEVGEVERARWSGRLDISQNRVYNHVSDEERVENARNLGIGGTSTNLATLTSKHQPILLKDVGVEDDRVAHYTEFGVCVHDFAVEPCTKFRDCLTCKKHKCIKGDAEKERRIRQMRDGLEETLKQATKGVDEGFYGADRWLSYAMDRLGKANALIGVLDNPEIAEGAVITCSDNGYSALEKGLAAQGELTGSSDTPALGSPTPKPQADLQKLMGLLGR